MRREVHKFGGTSVGSADCIAASAGLIRRVLRRDAETRLVVVASAMTKVTDQLIRSADLAASGDRAAARTVLTGVLDRHLEALEDLVPEGDAEVSDQITAIVAELGDLIAAATVLGELSPRTRDRLVASGEKLSVRLFAARLRAMDIPARVVDADTFLDTDARFGSASPLQGVAERTTASALRPLLEDGVVAVVTGFTGRAPDGATTTLGRGGSDFTATYVAAAIGADEVTIWTDVSGVYTTDPRIVPEARVVPHLNYREAAELSYYGAKVLHQRTMIPVAGKGIPVWTRNSFAPDEPGTLIDGRYTPGSHPVKAITAIRDHALLSVEGKGMAGVPGVAARVFRALADAEISVTMISQSSSESSITFAVPGDHAMRAEAALKAAFRVDLSHGDIEEIVVRTRAALIAAVGLGMARSRGIAARVTTALADARVNILAIAQGSSELNITLAVDGSAIDDAVRALHRAFGLHALDTGRDTTRDLDLMLLGCGKIGRAFVEQVLDRSTHLFERFGLRPRVVAIADRSGYVSAPGGFELSALRAILDAKAGGARLAEQADGTAAASPREMVEAMLEYRLARPVLVDVSDSDASADAFLAALELGADVVTANKKPLAGPLETWRQLRDLAARHRRILRAEATVGAGLPVIDTLEVMQGTGDRIDSAEGCLSGTLGFVMSRLEEGVALSDAVKEAYEAGYTEPDPVADLAGTDVARKAVILARLCALPSAASAVELEGLVPDSLAGMPVGDLLTKLRAEFDGPLAERLAAAKAEGKVLRFVARVETERIVVGPMAVGAESPLAHLRGTDNMIVLTSERYSTRPLVISGPGAGIDVTAMGVLGDVLRIAAERT